MPLQNNPIPKEVLEELEKAGIKLDAENAYEVELKGATVALNGNGSYSFSIDLSKTYAYLANAGEDAPPLAKHLGKYVGLRPGRFQR